MDEFENSDSEKETTDSHYTFYQNAIHYQENENAFTKNVTMVYFLLSLLENWGTCELGQQKTPC